MVEVSVCIPTYNGCPFLGDALDSVLSQTCSDFEVLISDDGSTDDSLILLEGFMERVSFPVRLFKNSGLGISGNCNFLANESSGTYIKFLFQDDLLEPSCIELLLKEARVSGSPSLIFSNRRIVFESLDSAYCQDIFNGCQNLSEHWSQLDSVQDGRFLLEDPRLLDSPINKIGEPSNTLISKSAFQEVGGFDPNLSQLLDLDLWYRLMSVGKVSYVNQTLSSFRIHDSQQSVSNLTRGNIPNDFELLFKKLLSSKFFADLSDGFKSRALEKLLASSKFFAGLSDGFKSRTLEKLLASADTSALPDRDKIELMHKIDTFSQRMKFMESTFAWRARKFFRKNYYRIFPWKRKSQSRSNLDYYAPLTFSTFGNLAFEKHDMETSFLPDRDKIELMHKIDAFSQRMKFMEGTFAWRARKCFMKGYYMAFPWKRKSQSKDNLEYYAPLTFSTFEKLVFEKHENPLCSIIIPFYGQTRLTWLCLKALELNLEKNLSVEIILVDDNSEDSTELINSLEGVKIVKNPDNIGFLKSCNKAANLCRGKYLVFLNNDTQIQEGWLSPLVETLSAESNVGAIGSKLLYPDNTLQEAGGIIWRDATGCNYGKGKDHNEPQFNFVREVDYCSGASLATSRDLFLEMGGFSEHYAPAYYEDTDFCFNLRKKGHRVLYHPKSVVIHCEGASCGTSEEVGVKSYQRKNRHLFRSKWSTELTEHFEPTGQFAQQYSAANRLNGHKSILVIDTYLPFHDRESGGHRLFQILLILRNLGCQVSFLPHNQKAEEPYVSELQQKGIEVLIFRQSRPGIRKQLAKRLENVDIAWICRPQMYRKYGSFIRKKCKARIIYDTIDLHFLRIKREWELYGMQNRKLESEWKKFLREEKKFSGHCDLALTVTEDEALKVREWGNAETFIVPNIHLSDSNSVPEFGVRSGILFIGSYLHIPNIDAAKWLVDEIMPLVWEKKPETQLFLLGSNPTSEILQLRRSGVCVTGFVEDVKPYFDQAKVFVAPLRYGAGMKGKIGQSMSLGLPVVTTSIGAEGMNLKNGKHAFISEDPEGIAQNIAMLSSDEAKWNELSTAGMGHMEEYSPEIVSVKINEIVLGSL